MQKFGTELRVLHDYLFVFSVNLKLDGLVNIIRTIVFKISPYV